MSHRTRLLLAGAGSLFVTLGILAGAIGDFSNDGSNPFGRPFLLLLPGVWLLGRSAGGNRTPVGCLVNIASILGLWFVCWSREPDIAVYLCLPLAGIAMGVVIIIAALWHHPGETKRQLVAGRAAFTLGVLLIIGGLSGVMWLFHVMEQALGDT
jgi:hypothetical protein